MSIEELQLKTEAHRKAWGLDKILRRDFNQGSRKLEFSLPDGLKAVAPAQIIGTYNSEDHTWLWAWANPSIDEKLQADARQLLKYGEEHHIERLTKRKWVGTEEEAWAMAALAVNQIYLGKGSRNLASQRGTLILVTYFDETFQVPNHRSVR